MVGEELVWPHSSLKIWRQLTIVRGGDHDATVSLRISTQLMIAAGGRKVSFSARVNNAGIPLVPALMKQKQKDLCEFEVSLLYIASFRPA